MFHLLSFDMFFRMYGGVPIAVRGSQHLSNHSLSAVLVPATAFGYGCNVMDAMSAAEEHVPSLSVACVSQNVRCFFN